MEFLTKTQKTIASIGSVNIPNWTPNTIYTVGMEVNVTQTGFEGTWQCAIVHKSPVSLASTFSQDIENGSVSNWNLMSSPMGDREFVWQSTHGFVVGNAICGNGNTSNSFSLAQANNLNTSQAIGVASGITTNTFVLSKNGSRVVLTGLTASAGVPGQYYLSPTVAGGIQVAPVASGNYTVSIGTAISTTILEVIISAPVYITQTAVLWNNAASYYFDGITTNQIIVPDSDNLSFVNASGDTPFTLLTVANSPTSSALDYGLCSKYAAGQCEYDFHFATSGTQLLFTVNQSASVFIGRSLTSTPYLDGKVHSFVATYDGSKTSAGVGIYVDSNKVDTTNYLAGSYTSTVNGTASFVVGNLSGGTIGYKGSIYRQLAFNYAISQDKIVRYSSGNKLDFEDFGGSNTDLSSGLTWTNMNLTGFTTSGKNITAYTANSNSLYAKSSATVSIQIGKKYRVYYTHTGTTGVMQLSLWSSGVSTTESTYSSLLINGSGFVDLTATVTDATALFVFQRNNAGTNSSGALNITSVVQLGATLIMEPEKITPSMWFDSSCDWFTDSTSVTKTSPTALDATISGSITAINYDRTLQIRRVSVPVVTGSLLLFTVPSTVESFDIDVRVFTSGSAYYRVKAEAIRLGSTWEIGNETSQGDNTAGFTLTVLDTGGVYGTMVSGTSNAVWTYTPKDI